MDDFYLSSVLEYILSPKGGQRSATIVYTRAFLLFLLDLLLGRLREAVGDLLLLSLLLGRLPRSGWRPIVIVSIIRAPRAKRSATYCYCLSYLFFFHGFRRDGKS